MEYHLVGGDLNPLYEQNMILQPYYKGVVLDSTESFNNHMLL